MAASLAADGATKPFDIAIVGGGLGGIVLSIGLFERGVSVHIYEAANGFGELGAGVAFGPNSVRALGLVSPEILQAYKMHATFNESPDMAATWLSFRRGTDCRNGGNKKAGDLVFHMMSEKHARSRTGMPTRCCVHRAKFLDEIIKLIPEGTTSFNKSLTHIEELPATQAPGVRLHFKDGSSATASAVIGCDGIKSKTRQHLHGDHVVPDYAGEYAYRALVPTQAYEEVLGHELTANGQLYIGHGRYMITYPVEQGKSTNMVAVRCKPGTEWKHEKWLLPSTNGELLNEFEGWHPGLVDLLSRYGTRDKWALFDNCHSEKYCRGLVCLLGDSAHATTPHLGAGAGQAMEDAYILSSLLGSVEKPEDLPRAFEAYDAVRRPRTQQVVKWSRLTGLTYTFLEEGSGDHVAKIEEALNERYHWLWDEDLEKELDKARELMILV